MRWAYQQLGPTPTLGSYYAVSDDGVGKIEVEGTDETTGEPVNIRKLFPRGF
jgi:hypothetical protein